MRQLPILPVALAAIAFGGCGSLDSNTDQLPVLATVQGKVIGSNDAVSVKGAVRVAVVWHIPVGGRLQVAQDLPVQPVFPASFTIQLDGPPPPEAMTTVGAMTSPPPSTTDASFGTAGGGGGGVMMQSLRPQVAPGGAAPSELAVGTVVAYADTNGNGMLDLLKDDAGTYIDQVVATNVDLSIVYFQGPVPPEARLDSGIAPVDGYNVVSLPPCPSPPSPVGFASLFGSKSGLHRVSDAGAPVTAVCMPTLKWLPISTPFVLTVASEPEVSVSPLPERRPRHPAGRRERLRWAAARPEHPAGALPRSLRPVRHVRARWFGLPVSDVHDAVPGHLPSSLRRRAPPSTTPDRRPCPPAGPASTEGSSFLVDAPLTTDEVAALYERYGFFLLRRCRAILARPGRCRRRAPGGLREDHAERRERCGRRSEPLAVAVPRRRPLLLRRPPQAPPFPGDPERRTRVASCHPGVAIELRDAVLHLLRPSTSTRCASRCCSSSTACRRARLPRRWASRA